MNFDNLMHYDLILMTQYTMLFDLLILLFWLWTYSLQCVIQSVKEFKIHTVETVSQESQKSNAKFVTYVKRKSWSKGKLIIKKVAPK